MADYINREKIQYREIVDYYDEQNMCEIHCDVADKVKIERLPTADVVERSKINNGFREIERLVEESMREAPCSEVDYRIGLRKAMATIERYIGE